MNRHWHCDECDEQISLNFAKCWQCGTTIQGQRDPNFRPADEIEPELDEASNPFQLSNLFWANLAVSSILLLFATVNRAADPLFFFGYLLLIVAGVIYMCAWGYPALARLFQNYHRRLNRVAVESIDD